MTGVLLITSNDSGKCATPIRCRMPNPSTVAYAFSPEPKESPRTPLSRSVITSRIRWSEMRVGGFLEGECFEPRMTRMTRTGASKDVFTRRFASFAAQSPFSASTKGFSLQFSHPFFQPTRCLIVAHRRGKLHGSANRRGDGAAAGPRVMDGVNFIQAGEAYGHNRHAKPDGHHTNAWPE